MTLDEHEAAERYLRRAVAMAPDSRLYPTSGADAIDINARYNLGTVLVNRLIAGTAHGTQIQLLAYANCH